MEVLLALRRGNKRVKWAKMLQACINPGQPTTNTPCIAWVLLANGRHGEDMALFAYSDSCVICTSPLTVGKCNCNLNSAFICNIFFDRPVKAQDNFGEKNSEPFCRRPDCNLRWRTGHSCYRERRKDWSCSICFGRKNKACQVISLSTKERSPST